jgi:class 3 adenylate cyclase
VSGEPQIRYCTTADGVSIAWAQMGQGPPLLLCCPAPLTHVQEYAAIWSRFYGVLARFSRVIWFDARGTGMSERDVTHVSAATLLMDAEAVMDAAKIDECAVFCRLGLLALSTALQLATEHPDRVSRLVLFAPYQRMNDVADTAYGKAGLALAEADWPSYVAAHFLVLLGLDSAAAPEYAQLARTAATWADPAVGLLYRGLEETIDLGDVLARVRQPTIVLNVENQSFPPVRASQRIAAKIPGAQFRQLSLTRVEDVSDPITAFLGISAPATSAPATQSGISVVLFTDIVNSTALTERMGDAAFRDASRALDAGLRAAIRDAGGAAIDGKLLGDGVLATFPSAAQAIDGARRCLALSAASELGLHIGLHAGDVIREDNNVYGGAVNIASRICGLSAPGEILVSDVVRGMARSSAGVEFEDRGEQEMKGVGEPVRVYAVRMQGA